MPVPSVSSDQDSVFSKSSSRGSAKVSSLSRVSERGTLRATDEYDFSLYRYPRLAIKDPHAFITMTMMIRHVITYNVGRLCLCLMCLSGVHQACLQSFFPPPPPPMSAPPPRGSSNLTYSNPPSPEPVCERERRSSKRREHSLHRYA
jgi:hypothetical protein